MSKTKKPRILRVVSYHHVRYNPCTVAKGCNQMPVMCNSVG